MRAILATILLCLGACGGGLSESPVSVGPAPQVSEIAWTRQPSIDGVCCNYTSILVDGGKVRIYSNTNGSNDGGLWLHEGGPTLVFTVPDQRDAYIRTLAVVRGASGYFALLYTGDGYPTQGGYSPSWATSLDGKSWTWRGPISPYGRNQSSGQALTVDESEHFRAWIDGVGGKLHEMRSADGLSWQDVGDIWPATLPEDKPVYPSAVRTRFGTLLAVANGFPVSRIRTLWQCNGGTTWRVVEDNSPIREGPKGVALAYDAKTGLIHSYANGSHWTTVAGPLPC